MSMPWRRQGMRARASSVPSLERGAGGAAEVDALAAGTQADLVLNAPSCCPPNLLPRRSLWCRKAPLRSRSSRCTASVMKPSGTPLPFPHRFLVSLPSRLALFQYRHTSVPGRASAPWAAADADRHTRAISPLAGVLPSNVTLPAAPPLVHICCTPPSSPLPPGLAAGQ